MSNLSDQKKKNRKGFSKTMKGQIKKKPHTQPINGIDYTYGLLQKKSQSTYFNNQRFLIIKGHQTFGYASKLPDETLLPFLEQSNIPKCKVNVELDKLQINNQKQVLIVEFKEDNKKQKTIWQFKCGSKVKAIQWRQKLQGAKNQRIANLQNNAVKVIIQDPNQNLQESQMQQKKKIQIVNYNNLQRDQEIRRVTQEGKVNPFSTFVEQEKAKSHNSAIMVREEQNQGEFVEKKSQKGRKTNNQQVQNINPSSQVQKFPQFNIFESLLSSSPSKKPLQSSKLNQQSHQKSHQNRQPNQQDNQNQNSPFNKAKDEYVKRKKEESLIKEQLLQQNNSIFKNVLKTVTDSKYQIQKLKKEWGYEFAKGVNEFEIIQTFKIYIETITMKIVDQLALQSRKRYYKPVHENSESIKYEIEGVSIQFFLNQLNQVASFQGKGSIISNPRMKQAYQELKNYDYILQLTNNKGRIRVPLAMCVQYKGFVGLAKIIIPQSQNYQNLDSLQKQLDLLQAQSRINNSVFEDTQNGRIIPLQSKIYQKIARAQHNFGGNNKKFDICYVDGLKNYLPQDFYRFRAQNSKTSNSQIQVLRKQLIQDQEYEDVVFYGDNMMNVINRLKIPQHLKQGAELLTQVSKSISDRVNALVLALQNMDQTLTNSKDLSNIMHGYGINMRYLGLLLERSKQGWLKAIVISQIVARCAKYFLKFDLQDCILNLNESKVENIRRYQIKQVVSFLNKLLGNSEETDLFWNQLSRQSQEYFQCYIDRALINVGFLLQSIQVQCRIKLKDILEIQDKIFKTPQPFTSDHFSQFSLKSKTYNLSFTDLYTTVNSHLKDLTPQSFEQLSILLNIQRKGQLPQHFKLNNFDQKIILYMINWLSPMDGKQIYYPEEIQLGEILPSKMLYQLKLTEIKWLLKDKKQQQAQKVRDFILEHVNKWLGQYHPILSQLYDLFSRYYLTSKLQQKKSITYCKSSIKNIQKLLSSSHIKLADNYYMLGQIYINYQKKTDALSSLKRAKQILQERQGEQTQAYGIIGLRMGQLLLANNLLKQSLEHGVKAFIKLSQSDDLQKFVQSIQLIARCYQVVDMWSDYVKFTEQIINNSNKLETLVEDPLLLQRTVKVLLLPHFNHLSRNPQVSRQILLILQSFTSLSNLTPSIQNSGYSYIKSLLVNSVKVFPNGFISILNNELQQLLQQIQSSGIMTRWKGFENLILNKSLLTKMNNMSGINSKSFQFLSILEALAIFLGQGWIEGVLHDE